MSIGLACQNSRFNIADHFVDVSKMTKMPSKPRKEQIIGFAEVSKTKIIEKQIRKLCFGYLFSLIPLFN